MFGQKLSGCGLSRVCLFFTTTVLWVTTSKNNVHGGDVIILKLPVRSRAMSCSHALLPLANGRKLVSVGANVLNGVHSLLMVSEQFMHGRYMHCGCNVCLWSGSLLVDIVTL